MGSPISTALLLSAAMLWSGAALSAPKKGTPTPSTQQSAETQAVLQGIADVVNQATQVDGDRRCKSTTMSAACEFVYNTQCQIVRPDVPKGAGYMYEVILPLGKLKLSGMKYGKHVGGWPEHHGLRLPTESEDITVVIEGNPPQRNKLVQLALGTDQASRAGALKMLALLKKARVACGGPVIEAKKTPAQPLGAGILAPQVRPAPLKGSPVKGPAPSKQK